MILKMTLNCGRGRQVIELFLTNYSFESVVDLKNN